MQKTISLVISALSLISIKSVYAADSTSYRAAVVEYYPVHGLLNPEQRTQANVKRYEELADSLIDQELDILVYPEATITTGVLPMRKTLLEVAVEVPDKSQEINPCNVEAYPVFFKELSCLAKRLKTYMVVNLIEKEECQPSSDCAPDAWNMYNTNVVFDRQGTVIQRYRKYNPFGEAEMNITAEPEVATFDTDFNVTFGLFICFDILFEEPTLLLVRQGVKHLIFPTMWFSELPFLTALQTQNMFAVENDVVLLGAGANSASRGSGGTGIFQGKLGPVVYDIIGNYSSNIYVADVLKEWTAETTIEMDDSVIPPDDPDIDTLATELDNFYLLSDNLTTYHSHPVVSEEYKGTFDTEALSCEVSWKISYRNTTETHYDYLFMYYSGMRSFSGVRDAAVDVCGLVFCQDLVESGMDEKICARRYSNYHDIDWPYSIEEFTISAKFAVSDSAVQYPSILLSSIRPLSRSDYEWSSTYFDNEKTVQKTLKLLKPQTRLLTFAIYGRDFARDSSTRGMPSSLLIVIGLFFFAGKQMF